MPPSEIDPVASPPAPSVQEVPDEDLDRMILTRLALLGVDLSVLPEDDPDVPADRRRILASARRFLRSTPPALADFAMDPQEVAPVMYPAGLGPAVIAAGEGDRDPGSTGGSR
jgi:hypothetical protein